MATVVVVVVAGLAAPASASAGAVGSASQVVGWAGADPVPVGLAASDRGALTAAFTTATGQTSTLWSADRPPGQAWTPAEPIASDVDASTAQFSSNRAGAAVLVWDAGNQGGGTTLWASVRPSAGAAWSAATAVVTDHLATHQPAVGIDSTGSVTVGYVHEVSDVAAAFTRRLTGATWSQPLQHSTAPVEQLRIGVAASGYVTLVWSQVEGQPTDDDTGDATLYSRRFLAPSGTWAVPVAMGSEVPPTGLVDLAVNAKDLASVVFYSESYGHATVELARSRDGFATDPCWPDCPNEWVFSLMGSDPAQSVSVDSSIWGETFLAARREELDGSHSILTAQGNGSGFRRGAVVSASGDVGRPRIARSDSVPAYGSRVGVSWLTRTAAGEVLDVIGEFVPPTDDPLVDRAATPLGLTTSEPALAVEPLGDTDVLWADAADGTLRSHTISATRMTAPTRVHARTTAVPVGWTTTTRDGSGASYDVRVREATARRGFGGWATWRSIDRTATRFRSLKGRTVCFATRVRASEAPTNPWSPDRCTTTAVDDTALTGVGWHRHSARSYYGRSLRSSARRGASLSVADVRAKSLALLVSRRPRAGRVRVSFGGRTVATVSTAGRRGEDVVIPITTFAAGRRGDLTVTVVSDGRPVNVDGVFVSAR